MFDMLTGYLSQAQYFAQQNPWIWLIVAAVLYFFVVRPMMKGFGAQKPDMEEPEQEGFSGGQTFEEQ